MEAVAMGRGHDPNLGHPMKLGNAQVAGSDLERDHRHAERDQHRQGEQDVSLTPFARIEVAPWRAPSADPRRGDARARLRGGVVIAGGRRDCDGRRRHQLRGRRGRGGCSGPGGCSGTGGWSGPGGCSRLRSDPRLRGPRERRDWGRAARPRRGDPFILVRRDLHSRQRGRQLVAVAEALGGILGERALHDPDERAWSARRKWRRWIVEMVERKLDGGLPLERGTTREHLVQNDADAVDVGRWTGDAAGRLFRRHVSGRSGNRRHRSVGAPLCQAGHAEVPDLDPPVPGDEDVCRLDVAVDHALRVRPRERACQLQCDFARLRRGDAASAQPARETLAVDQLSDVVEPFRRCAHVEDLDDPWVTDRGEQLRLALEAPRPLGILGPPRLDHLDRDRPRQAPVTASVDATERALADDGVELVSAVEGEAGQVRSARHCGCLSRRDVR